MLTENRNPIFSSDDKSVKDIFQQINQVINDEDNSDLKNLVIDFLSKDSRLQKEEPFNFQLSTPAFSAYKVGSKPYQRLVNILKFLKAAAARITDQESRSQVEVFLSQF